MRSKLMKRSMLPMLVLSLVVAGCENSEPTNQLLGPEAGPDEALIEINFGNGYTIVRETELSVGAVSATVGTAGGTVILDDHALIIPAGAVDGPTLFTITKLSPDRLRFGLTATSVGSLDLNNVGEDGFDKPLKFAISYGDSRNVSDPRKLKVVWHKPGGDMETQPTSVDTWKKWAIGELDHFSDYALVMP